MTTKTISIFASKGLSYSVLAVNMAAFVGLCVVGGKAISFQSGADVPPVIAELCLDLNTVYSAHDVASVDAENALRRQLRARPGTTGYTLHLEGENIWLNPPSTLGGEVALAQDGTMPKVAVNCGSVQ